MLTRNQRSKGFKVKHFLQICLWIAIFFWLFNKLKHSYYDTKSPIYNENKIPENPQMVEEIAKLGRKHLYPRVDETISTGFEKEETKAEDTEDDGRERAEDEETEEVEDLIDVDDRDRDVGNEEQDNEDKGERKSEDGSSESQTVETESENAGLRLRKVRVVIANDD